MECSARFPTRDMVSREQFGFEASTSAVDVRASVPRVSSDLADKATVKQCRICWGEEEQEGEGGVLLSPCKCSGSVAYVHERCLCRWVSLAMLRKGRQSGLVCDMCRQPYRADCLSRMEPVTSLPSAARVWSGRLPPRVVPFAAAAGVAAGVFGAWGAASGALHALNNVPALVVRARLSPRRALLSVLPRLAASLLCEAALFRNYSYHLDSAAMYAFGWVLDATARHLQVRPRGEPVEVGGRGTGLDSRGTAVRGTRFVCRPRLLGPGPVWWTRRRLASLRHCHVCLYSSVTVQGMLPAGTAGLAPPGDCNSHLAWTLMLVQALGLCHQAASLSVLCVFSGGLVGLVKGLGVALFSPWRLARRLLSVAALGHGALLAR